MMRVSNEKGFAVVAAVLFSVLVTLSAGVVLNMTFARMNMSNFQESRMISFYAAEAGVQYANGRLLVDTTFSTDVKNRSAQSGNPPYIVSCLNTADAIARGHISSGQSVDIQDLNLKLGKDTAGAWGPAHARPKDVTLKITEKPLGSGKYEVKAVTDYGMVR